jgi:5-methylcytosine-specific restriction endonuclease McrA
MNDENNHITTKVCRTCKEEKDISKFTKHKITRDGYSTLCKGCQKQYRINNKEKIMEYDKQYKIKNKKNLSKKKQKHYNSLALYLTYKHQLTIDEEPRLSIDGIFLEVRCKYCGFYFKPTNQDIWNRVKCIKGTCTGEKNLYCSDNCKKSCGTYRRQQYPKGHKQATSREVQPQLRKRVFKNDDWTCQICWSKENLHCHHLTGVELDPVESADVDNCITLCKGCHKKTHKLPDCAYHDLRRKKCDQNQEKAT